MAGRAAIPLVRELFTSIAAKLLPGHDVCDTVHIVEEDRISKALARIDAATARLEQAADRPLPPQPEAVTTPIWNAGTLPCARKPASRLRRWMPC